MRRHVLLLLICTTRLSFASPLFGNKFRNHSLRKILQTNGTICFSHDDCANPSEFCGWVQCRSDDGSIYQCGSCRPCSMCICNSNSTDNVCPRDRCPSQPALGVLYWQGVFYGSTPLNADRTFTCVRRLAIFGNTYFFLQIPVSNAHPASTANLNSPAFSDCNSYAQTGVLKSTPYISNGVYLINVIITSEGTKHYATLIVATIKSLVDPRRRCRGVESAANMSA